MRSALILATLDDTVAEIIPCPKSPIDRPEIEFQYWVRTDPGFTLVLVTDFSARQLQLLAYGELVHCVSRQQILNHPAEALARQVWRHSKIGIDPAVQVSVLDRVAASENGQARLMDLLLLGWPVHDVTRQVMALTAAGVLSIDMAPPLRLDTMFRIRETQPAAAEKVRTSNRFAAVSTEMPDDDFGEPMDAYERIVKIAGIKDRRRR